MYREKTIKELKEELKEGKTTAEDLYSKALRLAMDTPSEPEIIVPEEDKPSVEVVKVADKKEDVKAGETVNYTITVKNTGNVTLKDVAVSDTITTSAGDTNLPIYSDNEYKNEVTSIATIQVGETITLYTKYTVTQADIDAQVEISNIATAMDTPSDPEIVIPEEDKPSVEVVKVADVVIVSETATSFNVTFPVFFTVIV